MCKMEREEIQQELAATNQFCELKVKEIILQVQEATNIQKDRSK